MIAFVLRIGFWYKSELDGSLKLQNPRRGSSQRCGRDVFFLPPHRLKAVAARALSPASSTTGRLNYLADLHRDGEMHQSAGLIVVLKQHM
jgi:hypothetical protein